MGSSAINKGNTKIPKTTSVMVAINMYSASWLKYLNNPVFMALIFKVNNYTLNA